MFFLRKRNRNLCLLVALLVWWALAHPLTAGEFKKSPGGSTSNYQLPSPDLLSVPDETDNATDTTLVLGKDLKPIWFLQTNSYHLREDHPLNPQNALFDFRQRIAATCLDLDWNPRLSDGLSVRSRAIVHYRVEDDESFREVYLLEAYLQWQNTRSTFTIDLGKVNVAWGSGYAWNPTQVLIPLQEDISTDVEEDEGIEMLKLELLTGRLTTTALVAQLQRENIDSEHPYQLALKTSLDIEPWELSFVHHQATERGWTHGLSFTGLLTDSLEFHGEWTRSELRDRQAIQKEADSIQMGPTTLPARYSFVEEERSDEFDKLLLGVNYTFAGNMNTIVEWYTTTHGYDEKEWKQINDGISESLKENAWKNPDYPFTTSQGNPYAGFLKTVMASIKAGELRQNYLFLRYTSGRSVNNWEWEQIVLYNLDDQSQLHQGTLHKTWADLIKTSLGVTLFQGDPHSEFGLNPYTESAELKVEIRF